MADLNALSEKEKALYDLINNYEGKVTNEVIKENLSEKHVGALGKLVSKGLVEKKKTKPDWNKGIKSKKYYRLKENE